MVKDPPKSIDLLHRLHHKQGWYDEKKVDMMIKKGWFCKNILIKLSDLDIKKWNERFFYVDFDGFD